MKKVLPLTLLVLLAIAPVGAPAAFAQSVQDVVEVGGSVYVASDQVVNDAVAVGGSVNLLGAARGDVVAIGGSVLSSGEVVGDIVAIGGAAAVNGNAGGDVVAIGGPVSIDGNVRGDVVSIFGGINLSATSRVQGQAVSILGTVHREPGAEVRGGEVNIGLAGVGRLFHMGGISPGRALGLFALWGFLISFVLWSFTTLLTTTVFPGHVQAVGATIEQQTGRSLLLGLVASILVFPVTLVLLITIVGIPLAVLLWLALAAAKILGMAGFGMLVGGRIAGTLGWNMAPVVQVLIGIVAILAVTHVPFLGWVLGLLATMIGLGAVLCSRFGTNRLAS